MSEYLQKKETLSAGKQVSSSPFKISKEAIGNFFPNLSSEEKEQFFESAQKEDLSKRDILKLQKIVAQTGRSPLLVFKEWILEKKGEQHEKQDIAE